jgi:hypothetical protein
MRPASFVRDLVEAPPHEALDRVDGVLGVGDGLTLGDLADQAVAVLCEGHDRGGRPTALRVGDDSRLAAFHHGHDGVGRAEVNTDNLAHCFLSLPIFQPRRSPVWGASAACLSQLPAVALAPESGLKCKPCVRAGDLECAANIICEPLPVNF